MLSKTKPSVKLTVQADEKGEKQEQQEVSQVE